MKGAGAAVPSAMRRLLLPLILLAGCSLPSFVVTPVARPTGLEEEVVEVGSRDKVLVLPVEGFIANTRAGGGVLAGPGENKVSLLRQQLDRARGDDRVVAVVLRISSPGGTVTGSDTMYQMIRDYAEDTGDPVVASVQELGASGGYYVALAADEIHAQPTSIVGSVGVLIQTFDASGTLAMLGLKSHTITSGELKDMGGPFDELGDDERAVLQNLVDSYHTRFVAKLTERRPQVTGTDLATATDGRIFSGEQARAVGLIDELSFLDDAIDRARELAGRPDARAVIYKRPYGYDGSIYASQQPIAPEADRPLIALPESATLAPGAYYLYR